MEEDHYGGYSANEEEKDDDDSAHRGISWGEREHMYTLLCNSSQSRMESSVRENKLLATDSFQCHTLRVSPGI